MCIANTPQLEILNLLSQIAFSYLICNGDLHAKNISLQTLEDGTITLTPLYDLISTATYDDLHMAIKLDGRDDNMRRKVFTDFAERYQISISEASGRCVVLVHGLARLARLKRVKALLIKLLLYCARSQF